jgi:hypothetical protein
MIKALSFRKHAPNIATADDIAALETKLNFRFPAVFIELCSRWNGGFLAKDSQFYPVPSTFEEFYKEFGSRDGGVLVSTLFGATDEFVQCSLLRNYNLLNESSKFELATPTIARAVPGKKRWCGFSATNNEKARLHPTEHPNPMPTSEGCPG